MWTHWKQLQLNKIKISNFMISQMGLFWRPVWGYVFDQQELGMPNWGIFLSVFYCWQVKMLYTMKFLNDQILWKVMVNG